MNSQSRNRVTLATGEELFDTDLVILKHVALYFMTITEVVKDGLLPGMENPGNALAALARSGYLRDKDASGKLLKLGKQRYYLMGKKGKELLNLPPERATESPDSALSQRLATLWFCYMSDRRRYRLDKAEMEGLFGKGKKLPHHNTPYCVELADDGAPVLYRVYYSEGQVKNVVRQAREYLAKARENSTLRPWVEAGDYGFVILVETEAKCERIRKELARKPKRGSALCDEARFVVALGPTPQTLPLALASHRKKGSDHDQDE